MSEPDPPTAPSTPRHRRLQALRDRFIAANLRSRSLRLVKTTRSGACDLARLQGVRPSAAAAMSEMLGRKPLDVVIADHTADGAEAQAFSDDIMSLASAARLDEQLTGACDLAIGWPVLEGRGPEGTWLRGPVWLYPATLEPTAIGKRQWRLRADVEPMLNAPLMQAIDRACGVRIDGDALRGGDEDGVVAADDDTLRQLHETLVRLGLPMDPADDATVTPLQPLVPRLVADRDALPMGRFSLTSTAMLGRFPRAGSTIAADYDALLLTPLRDADLGAAADVLAIDEDGAGDGNDDDAADALSTPPVVTGLGSRRLQVLPSDKSQDAVFAFLDERTDRALVVQGPPGTGKSQLLTNLVVAAAGQGQRVLVVCQKRAALDVVAERLAHCGFGAPLALVHDVERDRSRVAAAVAAVLEPLFDASAAAATAVPPTTTAETERDLRLQASERAWTTLMRSPFAGRPSLAMLQERRLAGAGATDDVTDDATDAVPVIDDAVDASFTEGSLVAQQTRLESVWSLAQPWCAPHPLSWRGDWDTLLTQTASSSSQHSPFSEALAAVAVAADAAIALHTAGRVVSVPDALGVAAAVDDADDVLTVLATDGPARDALLLFWGWTGGSTNTGVWNTAVKRLRRAQRELTPVALALYSQTAAQLKGWSTALKALAALETSTWRFFRPTWWRLRKVVAEVFAVAGDGLVRGTGAADVALAGKLVAQAQAWHRLMVDLPDTDTLAVGIDGTMESIELALASLTERHGQVKALHRLHGAVARSGVAPLQSALDLALDDGGFVEAALDVRATVRCWKAASNALDAARPALSAFGAASLARDLQVGDAAAAATVLPALASAVFVAGAPSAAALSARAVDVELAADTPALRAFLRRCVPKGTTTSTAASGLFRSAIEAAWRRQALDGRDAAALEAPLTDAAALGALRVAHQACQHNAAAIATAALHARLMALKSTTPGQRALKKLLAEVKKKRRQPTLRSLTESAWTTALSQTLPVWLCSPESAAALFPPTAALFDLVIFDEASQCPVEAAIPALVRARRAIIAGDDQQMPPSHFFQATARDPDDEDDDDSTMLASQSVLELCRAAFPTVTLAWHYRSRDDRLIAFSNAAFYGGRLTTAPRVRGAVDDDQASDGLHFTRVEGRWTSQHNPIEAAAVVDRIAALLTSVPTPTVGVVAFNQRQAETIERLLLDRTTTDDTLRAAWLRDSQRPPVEQLFIRNLENVQGDERDVIVVSPAYGPDDKGVLAARFGPLGQLGGEKRLNVAITRARRGLHVVCSFDPATLRTDGATHVGPSLFKLWLQTVAAAAAGDTAAVAVALAEAARLGGGRGVVAHAAAARVEEAVGDVVVGQLEQLLRAKGLRVERAFGLGRHRLDLAVGPAGGDVSVGVDVAGFLSEPDPLARDVYGPSFWARAGWDIVRVTPRRWGAGRAAVVDDIARRLLASEVPAKAE